MKIACISYHLPPHDVIGAGMQMHYTANAYARHGHDVTMFSPYSEKAQDAQYEMVTVPVGAHNRTFRFAWNMRRQDFTKFDVLHAAGDDYWLLGKKRPYHIRTFHGSCFSEALHIKGGRERLRMILLGLSEWAACAVAERKVCVSHNTQHYIPFAKEVIWNGVDLDAFKPGTRKAEVPAILFVGTLNSRKRGADLLDIFTQRIRPALPDAELWIVREERHFAVPGVRWFGKVSLEHLIELYQKAWVFCLPSSYEGFGVPYAEAMACGTAVVATPNVGALEVLDNGRSGIIADLPELGDALLRILTDSPERQRLEQIGLERAQVFSWDKIVDAYLGPALRGNQLKVQARSHHVASSVKLVKRGPF
jgi:glycosyltransferase involved in cell wall biosynthesis